MPAGKVKPTEPTGPRPPLPGLLKVTQLLLNVTNPGRNFMNTFHVMLSPTGTPTSASIQSFLNTFNGAYVSAWQHFILADYQISTTEGTMLDGSGVNAIFTGSTMCTLAGPGLPPQCAIAVSWQTSTYWRGGKPRTYLGGMASSMLPDPSNSVINSTTATNVRLGAQGLIAAVNAATVGSASCTLGFVSYFKNYAFREPPVFFPFTGAKVHERIDSQRRRSGKESAFAFV